MLRFGLTLATLVLVTAFAPTADAGGTRPSFYGLGGYYTGVYRGFGPATFYGSTPTYGPYTHVFTNPTPIALVTTFDGRAITVPGSPVIPPVTAYAGYGAATPVEIYPGPAGGYGFPYSYAP